MCEYSINNQQSYDNAFLINSNNDFDFVDWVMIDYVKETHMILVAFVLALVEIFAVSQHKRKQKKDLLTIENTNSDLKVISVRVALYKWAT